MSVRQTSRALIAVAVVALAVAVAVLLRAGLFEARVVPPVTLTTVAGESLRLDELDGHVLLVNFWATTCAVCIREMPKLAELYEQYRPRGFRTLAVAMPYDPPHRVLDYLKRHPLPFDVALDIEARVLRAFGDVPGTPTSFLIDKQGNIVRKYLGEPDFRDLEARIRDALDAA